MSARAASPARGPEDGPPLSPAAEAWRARGRVTTVLGLDLFVVDERGEGGDGATPLLLLHGFPTSSLDWHRMWDALVARRRVIALDLPGYGFSAKPADYSYSLFEQADFVELVLREAGIRRAHVLAHDMGTSVATELLARRQRGLLQLDIDRVVLMNGSVHAPMAHLTPSQQLLRMPFVGPVFARLASRGTYRLQLRRILGRPDAVPTVELDDQFTALRLRDGHVRLPRTIGYFDERIRFERRWIGALEAIDRPLLVLWGRLDPVAVPAIAEQLARETPGARLEWMERLGHYPQLEDPGEVVARVHRFLDET